MHRYGLSIASSIAFVVTALALAATPAAADRYRVAKGDTLSAIARKSGCTVARLQEANGLTSTMIYAGQALALPTCGQEREKPDTASAGAKPGKDARGKDATSRPVAARQRSAAGREHGKVAVPGRRSGGRDRELTIEHVVDDGDTLASIADAYHTSAADLRAWNKLRSGAALEPGQTLIVARREATRPTPRQPIEPPSPPRVTVEIEDQEPTGMSAAEALAAAARATARMGSGSEAMVASVAARSPRDPYRSLDADLDVNRTPSAIPSTWRKGQSVGKPWDGSLANGAKLTAGDGYYIRRPYRAYGCDHVVAQVKAVLDAIHGRFPDRHDLAIGDISPEHGGAASEHHSHQTGRDVDIGFYFVKKPKGYPSGFVVANKNTLDIPATWALLKAFLDTTRHRGGTQLIFLDYGLQKVLYDWALDHEVPATYLDWAFQYPKGKKRSEGIVRHEPSHDDHLHVRFQCPPDDDACE